MVRARTVFLLLALTLGIVSPAPAASKDPLFDQQWGLQRIGAESAWSVTKGKGVLIAIIDTGVALQHPDLVARLVPGASVVDNRSAQDGHGHGTLVAGIAAASADNNEGIAGVAPEASILPVRVFDASGSATPASVARAIRFAVDAAAARRSKLVLNLSFVGPSGPSGAPAAPPDQIFGDVAVRTAIESAARAGASVITPAGNEGVPGTAFDAPDGKGIIVVGASNRQDGCASFSNFGPGIDVLAPGVGILSTFWNPSQGKAGYAYADGTSMSVPFVAGAAALLMSIGMTNVQAVERIIATAGGPGVSCRGEPNKYKILDVAAALGVTRAEVPQPADLEPSPLPTGMILPAGQGSAAESPQVPAQRAPDAPDPLAGVNRLRGMAFFSFVAVVILFIAVLPERKKKPTHRYKR